LDEWRLTLKGKRLRISRNKTEYIEYDWKKKLRSRGDERIDNNKR
jgi:hypothetical protein